MVAITAGIVAIRFFSGVSIVTKHSFVIVAAGKQPANHFGGQGADDFVYLIGHLQSGKVFASDIFQLVLNQLSWSSINIFCAFVFWVGVCRVICFSKRFV